MLHPRALIADVKFLYANKGEDLGRYAKYLQYREQREGSHHVQQIDEQGQRVERWVDRGLGDNYGDITNECLKLATTGLKQNVGARLMVISPEVHWMDAIPESRQGLVLRELTEATMEGWFDHLKLPTPEYSYVIHDAESSASRGDGRDKDEHSNAPFLHTHVIFAPTVAGVETDRRDYRIYEKQIAALHEAGRDAMEQIWTRELGVERVAELQAELIERTERLQALDRAQAEQEMTLIMEYEAPITPAREMDEPIALNREIPQERGLSLEDDLPW
jgi:hypothetical protein